MMNSRRMSAAELTNHRSRSRPALCVLLVALLVALGSVAPSSGPAGASTTWHVAPWGDDAGDGSPESPLARVVTAVDRAASGDTIELRGGVYRESVSVFDKALTIRSYPGERAVFDGAVAVDGFQRDGDRWYADGWWRQFYRERSGGPVAADHIVAGYPDQVFIDDRPLRQVLRLAEVGPGTFFHDTDGDRLWIGDEPSGRRVEASRYRFAFYFEGADGSRLDGVTVRRFATERRDMAAIRAYSDNLIMSDLVVELNARMGLSAIGNRIVVRDSRFLDNGYIGVHAERVNEFVLERSAVLRNNREDFDSFHSGAGVKLTRSRGITIRNNDVSWNRGPGVWTDLDVRSATIVGNAIEGNLRAGIELELSSEINTLSNVVVNNGDAGIWVLESQNVQVLHNASFGNVNGIEVEEGPRREVRNVRIMNNTVGGVAAESKGLIVANDWTAERPASAMGLMLDANAFWIPPGDGTTNLTRWARWPQGFGYATGLEQHRQLTGQGWNSLLRRDAENPFVRSPIDGDYRGPDDLQTGDPVTGSAAEAMGMESGERRRIGPVAPVIRR